MKKMKCNFQIKSTLVSILQQHGYFKWSDGWPMQISKWAYDPNPDSPEETCAAFNSTDGKWWPLLCSEKYVIKVLIRFRQFLIF